MNINPDEAAKITATFSNIATNPSRYGDEPKKEEGRTVAPEKEPLEPLIIRPHQVVVVDTAASEEELKAANEVSAPEPAA